MQRLEVGKADWAKKVRGRNRSEKEKGETVQKIDKGRNREKTRHCG